MQNDFALRLLGKRKLTITGLSSVIFVAALIWFFPTIHSEASMPEPTEVIVIDPLDTTDDFEFDVATKDGFQPGIRFTLHEFEVMDDNKVSFNFRDQTSRKKPADNVFAHHGVAVIGTTFKAPITGHYQLTFNDEVFIDSGLSHATMNFLKRPRADDNYVAAFAKFSYDVRAENYADETENYWTTQNEADIKDLEVLISAANIKAAAGDPVPVTTFATENPEEAVLIQEAGRIASNLIVTALASAATCPICGTALAAVTGPLVEDEIGKLLNEESNIFSDVTGVIRSDDDEGDRIIVSKHFGVMFPSATTFEVDLEEGELVSLSSRMMVGINQKDSSSRHRHSAQIAGHYELQSVTLRIFETVPPVIKLNGDNPLEIEAGTPYVDPGATVTDNVDGDLSASLVVDSSAVDTDTVGSYLVTYNASPDTQGNEPLEVTRTVNVVDTTPPQIILNEPNPLILQVGDTYVEPGATVTDNTDEDLSGALVIDASAVDTGTLGTYIVTYNVMDSSGNVATEVIRTVEVFDAVIDTSVDGPLKVGDDERVFISGGTIDGNIKLGDGTLILEDAIVNGNIQGNAGSTISLEGSTVHGFVQMKNCDNLTIVDSTVDSNVTVQNCTGFTLTGSTVGGNVDSKNTQSVVVTGNTIDGNIGSDSDGEVTIDNNTLTGIITVL